MVEIILLIIGIIYALRRPKLKKLMPQDFPGVNAEKFSEWQKAEVKGINIFLWATWGAFFIKIALTVMLSNIRLSENTAVAIVIAILIAWLAGLTIAAAQGSKAKKLRKEAGIDWPK